MTPRRRPQLQAPDAVRDGRTSISRPAATSVHVAVVLAAWFVPLSFGFGGVGASDVWVAIALCALSVMYAVVVRSSEQTRRALHDGYGMNLQTMWVLAGAAALPPALVPVVGACAFASEWSYQRRSTTARLERKLVTFAAATLAAALAGGLQAQLGVWVAIAVVFAETFDLVLIFVLASITSHDPGLRDLRARFAVTFAWRSLAVDGAGVGLAIAASYLLLVPGSGGVLGFLIVPAFVGLQTLAARVSAKTEDVVDPLTDLYTYEAWTALAGERDYSWPSSVLVVVVGRGDDVARLGAVVRSAVESFDPAVDRDRAVLVGRAGDAVCVVGGMNPGYAHPVVKRLERDLARAGLQAVVEETAAEDYGDLDAAVAEALRAGRRRNEAAAMDQRGSGRR